jgi:hypothetical protein
LEGLRRLETDQISGLVVVADVEGRDKIRVRHRADLTRSIRAGIERDHIIVVRRTPDNIQDIKATRPLHAGGQKGNREIRAPGKRVSQKRPGRARGEITDTAVKGQ